MKKLLLSILIVSVSYMTSQAQEIRINGYINYTFDDKFESYYSATSYFNGVIEGSEQWGLGLEMQAAPDYGVEFTWYNQTPTVPVNYWDYIDNVAISRDLDVGINYFMLGGVRYMAPNPNVEGYGGLMLGAAVFKNRDAMPGEPTSSTKFAWGLRLGANIWASDKIGLKLQGHLLSAVQSVGGGFYFGTGGAGAGVSTYSTILQFSLGGGICYRLSQ